MAAESPSAKPSVVSNTGTVPCGACSAQLYSAAEAGGQHRLIVNAVLGGEEADLLAPADDGQVDELGLGGVALDARTGTHGCLLFAASALVSNCRAAIWLVGSVLAPLVSSACQLAGDQRPPETRPGNVARHAHRSVTRLGPRNI